MASFASRRFGKRESAVAFGVLYPLVAISPYMLRFAGLFPANGTDALTVTLMMIVLVATALGVAGSILGASMMADVVEDAQSRTGQRSEGLFFAGSFFMQKCVSGLGVFLVGAILAIVQFPAKATPGNVPANTLQNLIITYSGLLVGLSLLAALVTSRFPLGGKAEHDQRVARLAEVASHAAPLPASEAEFPGEDLINPGDRLSPAE
jgi:GPH family glycoside/pentoside/hexuronide:cation symporter